MDAGGRVTQEQLPSLRRGNLFVSEASTRLEIAARSLCPLGTRDDILPLSKWHSGQAPAFFR